jgi:hypothetical protein
MKNAPLRNTESNDTKKPKKKKQHKTPDVIDRGAVRDGSTSHDTRDKDAAADDDVGM